MIANDVIASVSHSPCRQCTFITNCIYIYKICRPLRSTNLGYISPDYTYVLSHFSIHHKSQRIAAYTPPHSDRQYHNTPDDPASHPQHRIRHMPHMNAPITHIHMEIRNNRAFWKIQPDHQQAFRKLPLSAANQSRRTLPDRGLFSFCTP